MHVTRYLKRNLTATIGLTSLLVCLLMTFCGKSQAQEADTTAESAAETDQVSEMQKLYDSIKWELGPTTASIGNNAEIKLPEGYRYTGKDGARKWNLLTENPPTDDLGVLMSNSDDEGWFVVFQFDDVGYVPDDEKDELDADAILKSMQEGTLQSNEYRRQQGWPELFIKGWSQPPRYDEKTNNLVWATKAETSDGGKIVNHNIRLLGRHGVMTALLVASPEEMELVVPAVNELLTGYSFKSGQTYGDVVAGDKIAKYGLAALVAGGAGVMAAKTGLLGALFTMFAKSAKAIIVLIAALGAGIWKLLTGKNTSSS